VKTIAFLFLFCPLLAQAETPQCEPDPPVNSIPTVDAACTRGCFFEGYCWTQPAEEFCEVRCVEWDRDPADPCGQCNGAMCTLEVCHLTAQCTKQVRFCGEVVK